MLKKLLFILVLSLILASCAKNEIPNENIDENILVFSSYNLYDLENTNAHKNLAKFINDSNIGVMVSQEIQKEDKDLLLEELKKLGITAYIAFSSYGGYGGDIGDDYLAIISRWPIGEIKTILSGTYKDPISNNSFGYSYMRPVLEIKLNVFNKDITIFNLHLKAQSPWPACIDCIQKRRAQAYALENYIKENLSPETDNIIIAGDMNTSTLEDEDFEEGSTLDILSLKSDNPENEENDFLAINYEYKRETTHTRFDAIMDHILLSPELLKRYRNDSIDIVTPSGTPSDHKALLLILDFN